MKALGKLPRKKKKAAKPPVQHFETKHEDSEAATKLTYAPLSKKSLFKRSSSLDDEDKVVVEELTDLDKLYLALAEVGKEIDFNNLCYVLGINSLSALKNYNPNDSIIYDRFLIRDIQKRVGNSIFKSDQLAQKYRRSNVVETCKRKGIPVIQKDDVTVTGHITVGSSAGSVCEAQWTKPNGIKEKVCLRYGTRDNQLFLHEAEMLTLLRHKNILALHGVIIASSYSPSVALVVEFAEYGNLDESSGHHTVERLCRYTIQAATALEHLEAKKVIHQAFNLLNFLVVEKNQMKLAGLGFCQFESEIKKNLPMRYTQKDVVYMYAMLFSTFFAHYKEMTPEIAKNSKSHEVHGSTCPSHFCEVFDRCLLPSPEARPTFAEIRQSLVTQKYPTKVRVISSFTAESAGFISGNTGELITLISKDRHREDTTAWLGETQDKKIGFFKSEHVEEVAGYDIMDDSTVPPEIRARGPRAELAFQKAMQNGRVKVYRGRIMLLGQDRAGKTSLKKSLLGMPFNPQEESTIGVEVDPSKCEVAVDQVKNWEPTEGKKLDVSEFNEDIARLIAKDLNETEAVQTNISDTSPVLEQRNSDEVDAVGSVKHSEMSSAVAESRDANQRSNAEIDKPSNDSESSGQTDQRIQLNVDTSVVLPKDVTDLVVQYLQNLRLEENIKAKEILLTLWDFAGQHLYYASHSVFLSARAVYILVYNLCKSLDAEAEPCVRQGIHDIVLDNPKNETNLDNLLSWLVSVHSIRPTTDASDKDFHNQGSSFPYLRPPVFIVGTNADQPSEDAKKMEKCIQKNISGKMYEKHVIRPFFAVDNTKSQKDEGVQKLQKRIMEVLKQEPYMGEEVPLRWFNFEKVVEALVAKETYHMDLDQLLAVTRQVCRIHDEEELSAMLNFYHDLGVIVKHGHTVVLQAQWLINLFKQLITVRPFDEVNPMYSECWHELEESGILRMALVDHVFADHIQKGLSKQDILDMMELYGLIAKFSCLNSENEHEQRYFVPAQLRSSPSGLCKIKPSESDPCVLYIHFLDGFVPHGLFPQVLSRCIGWCSEHGLKETPQLFNNGARLFIGMQTIFDLILVCRKRFIKIILKRRNPASSGPPTTAAAARMAAEVRTFMEATLDGLSRDLSWLRNLRYELCVACTYCSQSGEQCSKHRSLCCTHDDCLHLLRLLPEEELICPKSFNDETVKVRGSEKWFEVHKAAVEEQQVKSLVPEASAVLDQLLSCKSGTPLSDDLLLLAFELGTSWKRLGRVLGLPEPVLEQIEEDKRELFEKCYGVLRRWTEAFGSAATYQCLARALCHPVVKRPELAAKHCDVSRDTFLEVDTAPVPSQTYDASDLSFPVFLSYQWDLQDTVVLLKSKIEASGLQCWMDIGEMGGGDALFAKIDAGIRACKVFVCCVTEKYTRSDNCQREATLADCLKKPIIPLLFEDISWPPKGQLSLIFARLLYIRITEQGGKILDSDFDQVMKKVQLFVKT